MKKIYVKLLYIWLFCIYANGICYEFECAICGIFRDEAPFLKEWIEFHSLQGVSHFYLYNNMSTDNYSEILKPYMDSGKVTLVDWPYDYSICKQWNSIQCSAYMNCIKTYGEDCKWIAFLDTDEFLFCCDGTLLPLFLKQYEEFGGVGVNWQMFGTNNIESVPEGKFLIEVLTKSSIPQYESNKHIKSIIRPQYVTGCSNPHCFTFFLEKNTVDENFQPVPLEYMTESQSIQKIRINHYWTRTEKDFLERKLNRRKIWFPEEKERVIQMRKDMNIQDDFLILQFIPKMKEAIQQ